MTLLLRCRRLLSGDRDYLSLYEFPILLTRKAFSCSFEFESQIFLIVLFTVENSSSRARVSPRERAKKRLNPLSCSVFRLCDV